MEGVQRLIFLARGGAEGEPTVPYPVQLGALKELFDRGFGKAPQQLQHSGELNHQNLAEELDGLVRRQRLTERSGQCLRPASHSRSSC